MEGRGELVPLLERRFAARPAEEWLARLDAAGVPCAPVQTVGEAVRDAALRERGGVWRMHGPLGEVETVASPLRLGRTPAALRRPAPALGEHTAEIEERGWGTE